MPQRGNAVGGVSGGTGEDEERGLREAARMWDVEARVDADVANMEVAVAADARAFGVAEDGVGNTQVGGVV